MPTARPICSFDTHGRAPAGPRRSPPDVDTSVDAANTSVCATSAGASARGRGSETAQPLPYVRDPEPDLTIRRRRGRLPHCTPPLPHGRGSETTPPLPHGRGSETNPDVDTSVDAAGTSACATERMPAPHTRAWATKRWRARSLAVAALKRRLSNVVSATGHWDPYFGMRAMRTSKGKTRSKGTCWV